MAHSPTQNLKNCFFSRKSGEKKNTCFFFSQEKFTGPLTPLFKELSIPFFFPLNTVFFFAGGKKKSTNFSIFPGFFSRHLLFMGTFYIFFVKKSNSYNKIQFLLRIDRFFHGIHQLSSIWNLCFCNIGASKFKTVHRLLPASLALSTPSPKWF